MATSPRPGVIQLDHPNIYMAAKEAQKDNWLRRGLDITGDLIQKRNQDVRYRRAAGLDEDRSTAGELAEKGIGKVWEGAKTLGSGIASVGESAWGLLKAPFTDEELAPTTTEDYRTEVGEKKTSPLAETPTDIIDSPEQILNAPKITTEVDGLPSTQTAEPGVKVSFPMTVAGTVERSKLPDTVVPKPTAQAQTQTPTQGQASVPQGMLQAPDWSEMFRLDPERAKYDWQRAKDAEAVAMGRDKLSQEASVEAAKLAQKAGQASSLEELQQLWKDNNRGLVEARKVQDPVATKMYQENIARLLPLLQEKAPAVWGSPTNQPPKDGVETDTGTDDFKERKASAKAEVSELLKTGKDEDSDGRLDNFVALKGAIDDIREKYNLSDADMSSANKLFDALVEQTTAVAKAKRDKMERDRAFALQQKSQAQSGGAIDQRMGANKLKALQENPDSEPVRADAVLWIMRKNSGAMIGPNEILQYMQGKLPADKYRQLTEELSPTGMRAILGLVTNKLDDAQITQITARYIPYLDIEGVKSDLNVYANQKPAGGTGGGNPKPKKNKDESMAAYLKRLDAWKAKGGK